MLDAPTPSCRARARARRYCLTEARLEKFFAAFYGTCANRDDPFSSSIRTKRSELVRFA